MSEFVIKTETYEQKKFNDRSSVYEKVDRLLNAHSEMFEGRSNDDVYRELNAYLYNKFHDIK